MGKPSGGGGDLAIFLGIAALYAGFYLGCAVIFVGALVWAVRVLF